MGSKPSGEMRAAGTRGTEGFISPKPIIRRDVSIANPGDGLKIIDDYKGSPASAGTMAKASVHEQSISDAVNKEKDQLFNDVVQRSGGGKDFSNEQIADIQQSASTKAERMINSEVKLGNTPDVVSIVGKALFEAMLELPQNQSITAHQKETAWHGINNAIGGNSPTAAASSLISIPEMQDYIDKGNISAQLDKALYPVMSDVRAAKTDDRERIENEGNERINARIATITSMRAEGAEARENVDAIVIPKLKEALTNEMNRTAGAIEMTDKQFQALASLYTEMVRDTSGNMGFLNKLEGHPRMNSDFKLL